MLQLQQRFFKQQKWVYLRIYSKIPWLPEKRMDDLKDFFVGSLNLPQVQEFDPDVVAGAMARKGTPWMM